MSNPLSDAHTRIAALEAENTALKEQLEDMTRQRDGAVYAVKALIAQQRGEPVPPMPNLQQTKNVIDLKAVS